MSSVLLVDPSLVIPEASELSHSPDFWDRLFSWIEDERSRLGVKSWLSLSDLYAAGIEVPRSLSQIVHRTVGDLLSRAPAGLEFDAAGHSLVPTYLGSTMHMKLLLDDISGVASTQQFPLTVVGSAPEFWPSGATTITCSVDETFAIPIHYAPFQPSAQEKFEASREWFAGRRILIVGGQIEETVVESLGQRLGIERSMVSWIPSERNKKATNIKAMVRGLPADAIIICVVGKVGHDVSGQVNDCARRAGIGVEQVRFASHITDCLQALCSHS